VASTCETWEEKARIEGNTRWSLRKRNGERNGRAQEHGIGILPKAFPRKSGVNFGGGGGSRKVRSEEFEGDV